MAETRYETSFAHSQGHKGPITSFWLAVLFLVAAGVGLAWLAAGPMRGETSPSGLIFRTIEPGSGPEVTSADAVLVEYQLTLPDGTVKDSSAMHGGPQAMAPGEVIPGFGEALTRMQKGGSYHFVVPPKIGYGDSPPPGIPPDTNLEFDVHVVDVAPGAAAMAAQAQAQQQGQQQQGEPESSK